MSGLACAHRNPGLVLKSISAKLSAHCKPRISKLFTLNSFEPSAVNQQGLTGDERCPLRSKPDDGVSDLLGLADTLQGGFGAEARFKFRRAHARLLGASG